ncbi:MAG: hypothetical protein KDD44_11670, partial [Bdellovibrionales bacterium]|nr:hypothetical protein [Bdellovibrionales bacterium]
VPRFLETLARELDIDPLVPKMSYADSAPFRRLKIQRRHEIVTIGRQFNPLPEDAPSLTPDEWHRWLSSETPPQVLDTRNRYEVEIGTFRGAIDPEIDSFREFPEYVERCELDKDKPVLMFCTGGIRCEKALHVMKERGFREVYQLQGGILNYLAAHPDGYFDGECFVFDDRVAVDTKLRPTGKYAFCPACGNPANCPSTCTVCGSSITVCNKCAPNPRQCVCSRACASAVGERGVSPAECAD